MINGIVIDSIRRVADGRILENGDTFAAAPVNNIIADNISRSPIDDDAIAACLNAAHSCVSVGVREPAAVIINEIVFNNGIHQKESSSLRRSDITRPDAVSAIVMDSVSGD